MYVVSTMRIMRAYDHTATLPKVCVCIFTVTRPGAPERSIISTEDERAISEYKNATLCMCLNGCRSDCRPTQGPQAAPVRCISERRYLHMSGRRFMCFDVSTEQDVGHEQCDGARKATLQPVISPAALERRCSEVAALTRWQALRRFLQKRGYSLAIAGPEPPVSHRILEVTEAHVPDWNCNSRDPSQYEIVFTHYGKDSHDGERHAGSWDFAIPRWSTAASCPRDRSTCRCHESLYPYRKSGLVYQRVYQVRRPGPPEPNCDSRAEAEAWWSTQDRRQRWRSTFSTFFLFHRKGVFF